MAERRRRTPRTTTAPDTTLERLQRWQARVAAAKQLRADWEQHWHVEALERYYLGDQYPDSGSSTDTWLNHFFASVQVAKPTLLPRHMGFVVQPKSGRAPFERLHGQIQEGVLQAIATQDDHLHTDARLAVLQAFFRVGVLKASYDPRFAPNPQGGDPFLGPDGQAVLGPDGQPLTEPAEVLTDEVYTWDWVDARKLLLPDDGPNPRKWSWIGEEVEVTLDEAKADPRFPSRLRTHFKANASADPHATDRSQPPDGRTAADQEYARFRYVECWDRVEKKLYVWADGQEFTDFLVADDYPPGVEDDPYALLAFFPIVGPDPSPWPLPLVYNWLPMQREYNTLRVQQLNAAKHAARKFLYEVGTFPDEEELDKFTSNVDMQGVAVTDLTRPPVMFGETSLNLDVARNVPILRDDWRVITGQSGVRLGDSDADTATEATLIEQAGSLRDSDLRGLVERWLGRAGSKMLQLVKQTLTLDLWVQLKGFSDREFQDFLTSDGAQAMLHLQYGPEVAQQMTQALQTNVLLQQRFRERYGKVRPFQVTREQLQFEADVSVLPASARPLQQAQLLRLVSILGPLAFGSPTLVEALLDTFDIPQGQRISEELMAHLRVMQQMQQQLQQQKTAGAGGTPPTPTTNSPSLLSQAQGGGMLG